MIAKLFSRVRDQARQPAATVPAGQRIYAIGDIHGRLDLLEDLLERVMADDAGRAASDTTIVFLGDLIDRGPESGQVVERLRQFASDCPAPASRFLLGNHEEVFLSVLTGSVKAMKFFLKIGGRETLESYGVHISPYQDADYDQLVAELIERVPPEHVAFLRSFEDLIVVGDYVFVHAGIRPGEPLARQKQSDLRWIRREFLDFAGPHEKVVVHGHSITDEIEQKPWRIGLDTGAFASGRLSAMGFEGNERWPIQSALRNS